MAIFRRVTCYLIPHDADAKATIATAKQMGVKVKMVTGDQIPIAKKLRRS